MADTSSAATTPLWRIDGQSVGMEQGGTGQFVKGVNVHFVTRSGLRGSVFVTDDKYAAPGAEQLIAAQVQQRAEQMERINSLQG